jgi:hypothetical protein
MIAQTSNTNKACLGLVACLTAYTVYRYVTKTPYDKFVGEIVAAEDNVELAEECLINTTIDQETITRYTPLAHITAMADAHEEELEYAEVSQAIANPAKLVEACDEWDGSVTQKETIATKENVGEEVKRVKRDRLVSANPTLEVRASRIVAPEHRATYACRVLDACRSKFGCPEVTKANHRAVWRFAEGMMKDHGLRPSHRVELLPYVVELCFVPSVSQQRATSAARAHAYYTGGAMESQLSLMGRWSAKLNALFARE